MIKHNIIKKNAYDMTCIDNNGRYDGYCKL